MKRSTVIASTLIFVAGVALFWSTAYPSITWWESSEYATAAVGPGISGPPGSLLLTLSGWLISKLAHHNPACLMNLFAGLAGSLTVVLLYLLYTKVRAMTTAVRDKQDQLMEKVVLVITALIITCSTTLWEYSVIFVPYVVTGLFTVLILISIMAWWRKADSPESWRQLFIIALLFGIDFSVHRTNAVLIPGLIVIILIRKPSEFARFRSYIAALSGFLLGLSLQLIYILISRSDPAMNMGLTPSLSGLWNYFSLKQYGGSFLLDILHRKGPLLTYQVPYYLKGLADNFFYFDQSTIVPGFIPGLLGLAGIYSFIRKDRRLGFSLLFLWLITIAVSIIYFNLPQNYFRTIYRHYLPTFLIFSFFIFEGVIFVMNLLPRLNDKARRISSAAFLLLMFEILAVQFQKGYAKNNGSGDDKAREHATEILSSADKGAIVFTYGDNDYFPVLYMQEAELLRTDVICLNLSLLNANWYLGQSQRHHPDLPLTGKGYDISSFEFRDWTTRSVTIKLDDDVIKEYHTSSDSVKISLPALRGGSNYLQDLVVFDIICNNRWKKPVYFVKKGLEKELVDWLKPNLEDEGILYKLIPGERTMPVEAKGGKN